MELEDIQKQVSALYHEHLQNYRGGLNLSRPHIPLISEAYLKNRIVILGQETNTWYRQGEDDLVNFYLENYDAANPYNGTEPYRQFISESVSGYPGKFWEFAKKLYDRGLIEGPIQKDGYLGHCWINLFSVEAVTEKGTTKGRPTANPQLSRKIIELQRNLLFNLFKIIQPKMLIALTGRKLNSQLFNQSLNLSWEDITWKSIDDTNIFDETQLTEVGILMPEHPLFEAKIVQAHHPSYFMSRINADQKISQRLTATGHEGTPSKHYQDVLFRWIHKHTQIAEPDKKAS